MHKKYIIGIALIALIVAGVVDWLNFQNNGGHSGNSIVESGGEIAGSVARAWVERSAPTYVFDGMNLNLIGNVSGECERCFIITFSFDSRHGGYGNREGLLVTQVITPHVIEVEVREGKMARAVTDNRYNELTGAFAE